MQLLATEVGPGGWKQMEFCWKQRNELSLLRKTPGVTSLSTSEAMPVLLHKLNIFHRFRTQDFSPDPVA